MTPGWRQIEVRYTHPDGRSSYDIVWVNRLVSVGNQVRFKGQDRFWEVLKVYNTCMEIDEIRQDWKVGGLDGRNNA